jgi:hypothetical protein
MMFGAQVHSSTAICAKYGREEKTGVESNPII